MTDLEFAQEVVARLNMLIHEDDEIRETVQSLVSCRVRAPGPVIDHDYLMVFDVEEHGACSIGVMGLLQGLTRSVRVLSHWFGGRLTRFSVRVDDGVADILEDAV